MRNLHSSQRRIVAVSSITIITCILPYSQVQAPQFPVYISHFLINCKKSKPAKWIRPYWKTISHKFYVRDMCIFVTEITTIIVWGYGILVSQKNQATDSFFSLQISQHFEPLINTVFSIYQQLSPFSISWRYLYSNV